MLEAFWNILTSSFAWGLTTGLIIGWNFLPQPAWIAKWFTKQ
jgi:hypothetical protein